MFNIPIIKDLSRALVCLELGFMKLESMRELTTERLKAIIKEAQG